MSSDQFNSTHFRRKDPVLRFSNLSEIKSIINRFESNDRTVSVTRASPQRPASYCGNENMIYVDRAFPMETVPYSDSTERGFNSGLFYYDDVDKPIQVSRFGALNTMVQFVLCFLKCWIGIGTTSFALMCVIVSTFAPRILTELFIYPCCRLIFGTLYPAYASYKAIRTKNVKEYVKWMMYWIVFALFTCAETFTDVFFSWLPFYYEIKIILVFWLLSPATKGSSILYRKFVHPALCRREQEIDECITKAKEQGYHTVLNLGSRGVNYATNVIMQTALKSGGGLVQQLRKSYSLSDLSASEDHSDGHSQQEIDEAGNVVVASDPRLVRRTVSVRGRSPRNFNSPKVDMAFPEMDVCVGHSNRAIGRDMVNLSQIRSSEDISSSYVPENVTDQDMLTRTSSVGGSTRMRSKVTRSTFTSIKRPGAAEDGEVLIEEVDDGQTPFPLEYLVANNIVPSEYILSDGTFYIPPVPNSVILNQYLNQTKENDSSKPDVMSDIELNYKKYLELKKLFEAQETVVKKIDESELPTVIDDNSKKTPEIQLNDERKTDQKTELSNITNDSIQNTEQPEKRNDEDISKKEVNSPVKEKLLEVSSKEDVVDTSLEPVGNTNLSIAGSLLSLISMNESSDGDFVSPSGSPRLESAAKNKKRRAPPPPVNKTVVTEEINIISYKSSDENSVAKTEELNLNVTSSSKNTENFSISDDGINSVAIKNSIESDNSNSQLLSKSNESKPKKGKQDSSISKLLHLPTKLAFWSKTDDDANKSASDNVSNEPDSSVENINVFEKSDTSTNSIIEVKNIVSLQKLSSSLDSINDAFEDAIEAPPNDETSITKTDSMKEAENREKNTKPVVESHNVNIEKKTEDVQYIPLKLETLVLHTESKSTDV